MAAELGLCSFWVSMKAHRWWLNLLGTYVYIYIHIHIHKYIYIYIYIYIFKYTYAYACKIAYLDSFRPSQIIYRKWQQWWIAVAIRRHGPGGAAGVVRRVCGQTGSGAQNAGQRRWMEGAGWEVSGIQDFKTRSQGAARNFPRWLSSDSSWKWLLIISWTRMACGFIWGCVKLYEIPYLALFGSTVWGHHGSQRGCEQPCFITPFRLNKRVPAFDSYRIKTVNGFQLSFAIIKSLA